MRQLAVAMSKRKQLGSAIEALRKDMNMSRHSLGDKTRVSEKIVEQWEDGELVPTTQEWQRMRAIFPRLSPAASTYADLFKAAAAEQLTIEETREAAKAEEAAKDELAAAVRLLIEAVPNLRAMQIDIDDKGAVSLEYRTRELRVVEETGVLRLPHKAT